MKFISSHYNQEKGLSNVCVQHLGKKFNGLASAHPDDKENWSELAGCSYAETRAMIEALKYERQLAKQKADDALDFVKSCECYSKFNKDDPSAKVIYRQLNQRIKRVNDLADEINDLYAALDTSIKRREIILNAIKAKKAKEDN
jgi:hypothetical protein